MSHDRYYGSHQIIVGLNPELIASSDKKLRLSASGNIELSSASGELIIDSSNFSISTGGNVTVSGDLTVSGSISGGISGGDISGDISILGDLSAEDIAASGSITADGNIIADGSITAGTTVTADSYIYSEEKYIVTSIPTYNIYQDANLTESDQSATWVSDSDTLSKWPLVEVGDYSLDSWEFFINITPWLKSGSKISKVYLAVEVNSFSNYEGDVEIDIQKATTILGISTSSFSSIGSDTNTIEDLSPDPPSWTPIRIFTFNIDSTHTVSLAPGNQDYIKLVMRQISGAGSGPIKLRIHSITVALEANSVEDAIGEVSGI